MAHALTEHSLPGLDPERLQSLVNAGVSSLEDVIDVGPGRLASLTGFDTKTCRALIRVAEAALARHDPAVIPFVPATDEPGSVRLARGLKSARRIERVMSVVRKARAHAGRRRDQKRWRKTHRRARRALKSLLATLEVLQQSVLSEGLSQVGHDHLDVELRALEARLSPMLDLPMRKRTLKRLRDIARTSDLSLSRSVPGY
ncbi:MAG: helix-hairpin-helix domain-containing protein [Myxococcota bacterium]